MDLHIKGRKAIVCASSEGLGYASAYALAQAGCSLVMNGRSKDKLETAAAQVRSGTDATVTTVVADVSKPEGRAAIIAACPDADILVNNGGGPPKKDFRELTPQDWQSALETNMLAAVALITHFADGMMARGFGRIVNITSMTSVRPAINLDLSNAARLGLTGFVAGVSRQVAGRNVTINNLLPGTFDTDRLKSNLAALAKRSGKDVAETTEQIRGGNPAKRFGTTEEFGAACAFLCSAQAGYITGQNFLVDGGAYPGTF